MSDPKETIVPEVPAPQEPVAPKEAAKVPENEPHWLNARLERERASMLKKFGFESVEDAQASATELKVKREAEKTAVDKAAEALSRAKKAETQAKALSETVSEYATRELGGLSEEQKAAVTAIAGEDPALQLKAIAALQPTWVKATETAKPVPAKAIDTAPPANAPAPTATSETNHRAQYEALRKSNPFAAAAYGTMHSVAVFGNGS